MTTKELYRLRYQQGATTTTEKRLVAVGEWRHGRPIRRTVTLPSDVITKEQLEEIAYPCEHKTANVLADDGATMTLRCTWGCGRTRTVRA